MNRLITMACALAVALTFVFITSAAGCSEPASGSSDIEGFFEHLPGDWVGTVSQSTDGKFTDTKYFHAAIKQLSPDTYETVFTYYRLVDKCGEPVMAGVTGMTTKIDAAGTATNSMIGNGDLLIDANTLKPETHDLTELLRTSQTGGLQGTGSGSISVAAMPLDAGKNGKVQGYSSTWLVNNDALKISQQFKVTFRVFLIRKSYNVVADYTAKRGTDVLSLMKDSQGKALGHSVATICPAALTSPRGLPAD